MNYSIHVCNLIVQNFINSIEIEIINDDIIQSLKNDQIDNIEQNTKMSKIVKKINQFDNAKK